MRTVHLRALGSSQILNLRPNVDLARRVPLFFADRDHLEGVAVTPTSHVSLGGAVLTGLDGCCRLLASGVGADLDVWGGYAF